MVTGISDLDSLIQVVVAEVQLTARHKTPMRQLVRTLEFPKGQGHPLDRPKLSKLTATVLTEGQDLSTPQGLTDTDVSITPLEAGVQVVVTDRMLTRAPKGFDAMVAEEMSRAYKELLNTDLNGLFSGFSNGLSAAGAALTLLNVGAGRARVMGNSEPGPPPLFVVLHPFQAWDVYSALVATSSGLASDSIFGVSADVVKEYMISRLWGMGWFEDGTISIDGSDDAYGAVFSKEALMLFIIDEGTMRRQRDESLRAEELNYVGEYGFGEWVDTYGYNILTDASAPTT
jgi:hypothetical protein